jgi:hypothetical protein
MDFNVRIPEWPPGTARLQADFESETGAGSLQAEVLLGPPARPALSVEAPEDELSRPPLVSWESGEGIEPPGAFQVFPSGGRLSSSHPAPLWIRVADARGGARAGTLSVGGQEPQPLDPDGFAEFDSRAIQPSGRLALSFRGEAGGFKADLTLRSTPAQLRLRVEPWRLAAGQTLQVQVEALSTSGRLYLEGWERRGPFHSSQLELVRGRASASLILPADVNGPVVIRVQDDPYDQGLAVREETALVGADRAPDLAEGFELLRTLPVVGTAASGEPITGNTERALRAWLSRVRAPAGPLPVLTDNQVSGEAAAAASRGLLAAGGLALAGGTSALTFAAVAWLLLRAAAGADRSQRRRALGAAVLALAVVGFGLAAGWVWLRWVVG